MLASEPNADLSHRKPPTQHAMGTVPAVGKPDPGLSAPTAGRGIRPESSTVCVTRTHFTADPGSTDIDSLAGPAVTRLMILEQMQHVFGAQEGPVSQQSVVYVRQSSPATDGDQPRITLLREDRHTPVPTMHEATSRSAVR